MGCEVYVLGVERGGGWTAAVRSMVKSHVGTACSAEHLCCTVSANRGLEVRSSLFRSIS